MTAQAFLQAVSQVSLLILFALTLVRLVRSPGWASFDIALFFGVIAVLVVTGAVIRLLGLTEPPPVNTLTWIGVTLLPLILLRLADDFRPRPSWLMVGASALYLAVAALGIVAPQPWSTPVVLTAVAFIVALGLYASLVFVREAAGRTGVTRRRMQAVGIGSGLLVVAVLLSLARAALPAVTDELAILSQVLGLSLALSYFIGFAPPPLLRRAWQESALRGLLMETPDLLRLADPWEIAARIGTRAASITGADGATVSLWDAGRNRLVTHGDPTGDPVAFPSGEYIAGRAFERGATVFSARPERDAPEHAQSYRDLGIRAIAATPIAWEDRRLGVLTVYAARPPVFTDDVLSLIETVAEHAALMLRSRELIAESAQVQALARMTRMRDDFLAGIAHDLRTPITPILLNAELLERSLRDDPKQAARASSVRAEALRLKELVDDYLVVIASQHRQELVREQVDLGDLVRQAVASVDSAHRVRLEAPSPVVGAWDAGRIRRLVENLLSNALKYSPATEPVDVTVVADRDGARLAVADHGAGIPVADRDRIFERFERGDGLDRHGPTGIGLGLYLCRQVAEEHGGSITVTSEVGQGSTFTVRLPFSTDVAATPQPGRAAPADPVPRPSRSPSEPGGMVTGEESIAGLDAPA